MLEHHINEWEDSDQIFLLTAINKQHDKLAGVFHRFVEEQVRAIEDMKVTAKKRQGILLMFKILPVWTLLTGIDFRDLLKRLRRNSNHLSSLLYWKFGKQ